MPSEFLGERLCMYCTPQHKCLSRTLADWEIRDFSARFNSDPTTQNLCSLCKSFTLSVPPLPVKKIVCVKSSAQCLAGNQC